MGFKPAATTRSNESIVRGLNGAHRAGDGAFGASHERPGVGRTPADNRLLALGYPHLLAPVDVAVRWATLETMSDVFKKHPLLVGEWPRELFEWLVARWDLACRPDLWKRHPARTDDVTYDLDALLAGGGPKNDVLLYALEALHGSRSIAEQLVARVEDWPDDAFGHKPHHIGLIRGLHFLLLRVESPARDALTRRLEAVFERASATCRYANGEWHETVTALDLALHGRAGVERSGYRPDRETLGVFDLVFAWDDREWVAEQALARVSQFTPRDRAAVDARLGFLGGDAVVEALCANVLGFHPSQRKRFVAQMGRFAHPAVPRAIEILAGVPGAKSEAKAWLRAHA